MQLEIKTTIDAFNPNQVKALNDFLTAIGSEEDSEQEIFQTNRGEIIIEKPKQTRKKAEKVEVQTKDEEAEALDKNGNPADTSQEPKAEAIEVIEPETVSAPTLMQIRSLVAQKAGEHKDSIKSKLVELGAQNVSTLDAKHFQTIFAFLTEL